MDYMANSRKALAMMLECDAEDLALIENATSGVNTVLRSLVFSKGDEILVPDHAYQACRNAIDFVAKRWGAQVVTVNIPFPIENADVAFDTIMDGVTSRTVLAMIDTVTSPTGLLMPFERLTKELEAKGVAVLLDAAHGIGMVPLSLDSLGASYTTSNCHKWMCAPKGSAFLHVRKDLQHLIHPLTISHGMTFPLGDTTRFRHEFDWTGTRDISAACSIPATIEYMENMVKGGWPAIMQHNHDLAIQGRNILCERLGIDAPCPKEMIACIATIVLPGGGDAGIPCMNLTRCTRYCKKSMGFKSLFGHGNHQRDVIFVYLHNSTIMSMNITILQKHLLPNSTCNQWVAIEGRTESPLKL